jgi:23S rRNA pseudouridine2605 synthase
VPAGGSDERLQKVLARAGVASRRAAEEMIAAGRVSVNGKVVTEMGTRANPATDKIEVDGRPIAPEQPRQTGSDFVYILLNKPPGVVSTVKDTHGRPTVLDLIQGGAAPSASSPASSPTASPATASPPGGQPDRTAAQRPARADARIYPVGRLDADTTGLLLLTNDGDLTFRLTHPRFGVEKEYRALVRGRPSEEVLRKLREGVEIEGEMTAPAKVEEIGRSGENTLLRITIHEGRKRQVRLMAAAVGHHIIELQRVRFGPLSLGTLPVGRWRHLATYEVHALRKAVRLRPASG